MIPIIWQSYDPERSAWLFGDQVMLADLLSKTNRFENHEGFDRFGGNGAIVMLQLNYSEENIDELNNDLARLDWCILILTANEYGSKAYKKIKHPNMRIWLQTPRIEDKADHFLGFGYPSVINASEFSFDKTYSWFFAGQMNHQRRIDCVKAAKKIPSGKLLETEGFFQGYNYNEYLENIAKSKIVLCPGGPQTPDTFRVYEALEMGAIPIVDKHAGSLNYGGNYWDKVFGINPLTKIEQWRTDLPSAIELELSNYDHRQNIISVWWKSYKENLVNKIYKDIDDLRSRI